jgi:hypothetical protein
MSDDKSKDTKQADEGKALAALKAELEAAKKAAADLKAELEKSKDEHIADLKAALARSSSGGGSSVLLDAKQAQEQARVDKHVAKLHAMREQAMEIAGPGAKYVKYIVGPSGTVRDGLGVVKAGKVISVSIKELPAGEWSVYDPSKQVVEAAESNEPNAASAIQRASGRLSAAEKAISQREALKSQREG